jgi:hypothetical protein
MDTRELVGREGLRNTFTSLIEGFERGYAQQSMLMTGLRGVGKTAVLRELATTARARRWAVIDIDAARRDDHGFRRQMAFEFRSVLLAISPRSKWKPKAVAASGVLGSFSVPLKSDSPLTAEWTEHSKGTADSGNLSTDMTAMLLSLGEAAHEHGIGVALVVDELQRLTVSQLGALIDGLHRTYLRELPITLVGAGLPRSDAISTETEARANRLFEYPVLDALHDTDAATVLRQKHDWDDAAVASGIEITGGIAVFLRALADTVHEQAGEVRVTPTVVEDSREKYEHSIDSNFFGARFARAKDIEIAYLRAIVDSPGEAEAARLLERTAHQCAEVRLGLIEKDWIFLRDDGSAAFTAPGADAYLRRVMPTLVIPAQKQRRRRYDP